VANRIGFTIALFLTSSACLAGGDTWSLGRDGVFAPDPAGKRVVELPGWHWADERYTCPPAMAVGPRGEALVTSNVVPTLWKVDALTLRVTSHPLELDADRDKDVGFSTLRYLPGEDAWIAFSAVQGSTWRIDAGLVRAQKLAGDPAWRTKCAID
jgi:hypothetical protein